ncbi:MAG: hypothetical protein F2839_01835 [Actinobacteria bacterium]|uniref:Unannotated protein n=1 Tax=freshwater metagenome TaxID=449393 RepID=A0A6J5YYC6_9ZZZZ|nr:hypothetical protein [Actinomycetota bacterium]
MDDFLLELSQEPEISRLCSVANASLDELSWNRSVRNKGDAFTVFVRRLSGYSSAALDGTVMPPDVLVDPQKSAMGDLANSALLITARADELSSMFLKAPSQVWAQLHLLIEGDENRGQPRTNNDVDDPLHLGAVPDARVIHPTLNSISDMIVQSQAPAVLMAAIVHAQLCVLRPFSRGSDLIARASARMIIKGKGFDPLGLCAIEYGQYMLGRPDYVKSLKRYMQGGVPAVTEYLEAFCQAIVGSASSVAKMESTEGVETS